MTAFQLVNSQHKSPIILAENMEEREVTSFFERYISELSEESKHVGVLRDHPLYLFDPQSLLFDFLDRFFDYYKKTSTLNPKNRLISRFKILTKEDDLTCKLCKFVIPEIKTSEVRRADAVYIPYNKREKL